ncbi:MAG: oxidoreductase [Candidatus Cloacimonadota bacterium]|nr:MAG: oxidoreductase [Candidatus Cloacimonadota bacterium]
MSKLIKVALLGLGNMGQNHLRNLVMLKNVEVSFIHDLNEEIMKSTSLKYNVPFIVDWRNHLDKVDALIIVTPTNTHYDYIVEAAKYVKNIFVEKPLTHNVETSEKIVSLAKLEKLNIQVGFIERYNPAITSLERVLKNSSKVIAIDFTRTNKVSSRITDVDVVIDLMIHDIDLALNFSGKPKSIAAHGHVKDGMIEYARALITHENGVFSNIVASRITEKRMRHVSSTCEDMYVDCNLLSKTLKVNKQTIEQYLENVSISSKEETIDVRPQEGLLMELIDFTNSCREIVDGTPNEKDSLLAIQVASSIQNLILEK